MIAFTLADLGAAIFGRHGWLFGLLLGLVLTLAALLLAQWLNSDTVPTHMALETKAALNGLQSELNTEAQYFRAHESTDTARVQSVTDTMLHLGQGQAANSERLTAVTQRMDEQHQEIIDCRNRLMDRLQGHTSAPAEDASEMLDWLASRASQ